MNAAFLTGNFYLSDPYHYRVTLVTFPHMVYQQITNMKPWKRYLGLCNPSQG